VVGGSTRRLYWDLLTSGRYQQPTLSLFFKSEKIPTLLYVRKRTEYRPFRDFLPVRKDWVQALPWFFTCSLRAYRPLAQISKVQSNSWLYLLDFGRYIFIFIYYYYYFHLLVTVFFTSSSRKKIKSSSCFLIIQMYLLQRSTFGTWSLGYH
jgi:hypothetical protein